MLATNIPLAQSKDSNAEIDHTLEQVKIANVITSVANYADTHLFCQLERLYAPEVTLDYSSLNGIEAQVRSPQSFVREWAGVLPGFDATQHKVTNLNIEIKNNTALATADVIADHYIDDAHWQVEGKYEYRLVQDEDKWLITQHRLTLIREQGSRDVFGPAIERAKQQPVDYLLRKACQSTILSFLNAEEDKDSRAYKSLWAEDGVKEFVSASQGRIQSISGRSNIVSHFDLTRRSEKALFRSNTRFYDMKDPQLNLVAYSLYNDKQVVPATSLFHVENGKVQFQRQYNPYSFYW